VIAEVKRRSPSKGEINAGLDAGAQAAAYAEGGAAALSILTEPTHFGGRPEDLTAAREHAAVPLLRKDFHVHPLQLLEAKALGASAVLLIARALSPSDLPQLATAAADLGLETLVEVRDEWELERAVAIRASVIGVNNRDLETLVIDAAVSRLLLPRVPRGVPAVYESGVRTRDQVEEAALLGADAVLVGSSVSAAADPVGAVRALTAVPRTGRGA
jgi:indole-3-glycerol phosphate synthase